jgi:uncharacterized iron-regulated protein
LTAEETALLPPNFELGNDHYYERFREVMKGHVPEEAIQNYFVAQSLWDETMAWKALESFQKHPRQTLMIIVGDFHVAWDGGLPHQLRRRGAQDLVVISQTRDLADVAIHPKYGPRADFIWVSKEDKP